MSNIEEFVYIERKDAMSPESLSTVGGPGGPADSFSSASLPPAMKPTPLPPSPGLSGVAPSSSPSSSGSPHPLVPVPSTLTRLNISLSNFPTLYFIESHTGIPAIYIAFACAFLFFLLFFRGFGLSLLFAAIAFVYPLYMSIKTLEATLVHVQQDALNKKNHHVEVLSASAASSAAASAVPVGLSPAPSPFLVVPSPSPRSLSSSSFSTFTTTTSTTTTAASSSSACVPHSSSLASLPLESKVILLRQWVVYWMVYGLFTFLESISDSFLSWLPLYYPLKLCFLLWCFLPQYQGAQTLYEVFLLPILHRHQSVIEESVSLTSEVTSVAIKGAIKQGRSRSVDVASFLKETGDKWMSSIKDVKRGDQPDGGGKGSSAVDGAVEDEQPVVDQDLTTTRLSSMRRMRSITAM